MPRLTEIADHARKGVTVPAKLLSRRFQGIISLLALATASLGCGGAQYEIAEVAGVVLIDGKPAEKLRIEFAPDGTKGTTGPTSTGETDEQGRYALQYFAPDENSPQPGAVVGWHRVVLSDRRLAESATGRGVPIRLPPEYTLVGSTPLAQEVQVGAQTIDFSIP
jgi:hypothetical protein